MKELSACVPACTLPLSLCAVAFWCSRVACNSSSIVQLHLPLLLQTARSSPVPSGAVFPLQKNALALLTAIVNNVEGGRALVDAEPTVWRPRFTVARQSAPLRIHRCLCTELSNASSDPLRRYRAHAHRGGSFWPGVHQYSSRPQRLLCSCSACGRLLRHPRTHSPASC